MRTWSWRRRLLVVGGLVVVLWSALVGFVLLDARAAASDGAAELRALRRDATIETIGSDETLRRLEAAASDLRRAEARTTSPVLWPLRVVPVASRHVLAADRAVRSARQSTEVAVGAAADIAELMERPGRAGPARLALLADLVTIATEAEAALAEIDPGSPDGLIGPLADAVVGVEEQRAGAEQGAARLAATSEAIGSVLRGPAPYLLLGANNAEMRNGSGMFLSATEIGFDDGRLSLGEVRPTAELVLPEGTVAVEGDLAANWPWLDPGRDLRTLGLTADFPQSAEVAVRTWAALEGEPGVSGQPLGGVLSFDIDGVRGLLRAVGPVEVDGITYTVDNVRGELLRDQYRRFADDRAERRDQLGEVARAIFERIEAGEWELDELAGELVRAVQGRHLVAWSVDEATQAVWADVGVAGRLHPDSVAVALLNRSATKLDSWIETSVAVDVGEVGADADADADAEGGGRSISLTYDIVNTSAGSGPPYLFGPNVEGLSVGDHVGLVVVNLPAGTTDVEVDGAEVFLLGGDGPTVVVGAEVTVRRGEAVTVVVTGRLSAEVDRIRLEPTARVPRTEWTVDGREVVVDRPRGIPL